MIVASLTTITTPLLAVEVCKRVNLTGPHLRWISSATAISSGKGLVVVDPLQNDLFFIGLNGKVVDMDIGSKLNERIDFAPAVVMRSGKQLLVTSLDQQVLQITGDVPEVDKRNVSTRLAGQLKGIVSLYDVTGPSDGTSFVGAGAVKLSPGGTRFGIFRSYLDTPLRATLLIEVEKIEQYSFGNPYLASNGTGDFVLIQKDYPVLAQLRRSGEIEIKNFDIFKTLNMLPDLGQLSASSDSETFRRIQASRLISGLYASDYALYLLIREPDGKGAGTLWALAQIDLKSRTIVRSTTLPTNAPHLTLTYASGIWFVLEKSSVKRGGYQDITSLILIPANLISAGGRIARCH